MARPRLYHIDRPATSAERVREHRKRVKESQQLARQEEYVLDAEFEEHPELFEE